MFLMVGNAYQRLEKYPEAIRTYGILENFYEDRPEGQEAGYRKLQCFLLMEEENLPDFIDHYIRKYIDKEIDHSFLDRARLLLAEFLFSKEEFARAADAYARHMALAPQARLLEQLTDVDERLHRAQLGLQRADRLFLDRLMGVRSDLTTAAARLEMPTPER
jgi:hypothetical protein